MSSFKEIEYIFLSVKSRKWNTLIPHLKWSCEEYLKTARNAAFFAPASPKSARETGFRIRARAQRWCRKNPASYPRSQSESFNRANRNPDSWDQSENFHGRILGRFGWGKTLGGRGAVYAQFRLAFPSRCLVSGESRRDPNGTGSIARRPAVGWDGMGRDGGGYRRRRFSDRPTDRLYHYTEVRSWGKRTLGRGKGKGWRRIRTKKFPFFSWRYEFRIYCCCQ